MADLSTDILIVGAGPGGAAAATEAARNGLDAVVVDKASFPRDKCCGDGLTTGALRQLDQLGLDPTNVPSWRAVNDVWVRTPSGRERPFPLPSQRRSPGTGVFAAVARRQELDMALVDLARSAGAEIFERHALVALTQSDDAIEAMVEGPTGKVTITADYLIAADGMWSTTRKLLGIDAGGYRGDWHAFRQYFDNVGSRAAEELLVWFEPDLLPGYAWSFPVGAGSANVGFGILRKPGQSVQVMKDLWPQLLARPHIAEALGDAATPEASHRAWPIPARLGSLPVTRDRVLFTGDALAAADPMTGEGIGQAIETGRLAAEAVIGGSTTDPSSVTDRYERELRVGMMRDHRLARGLSSVLSTRRGVEASVVVAGATVWTRNNFARWLFEDYPRASLVTPGRWHRRLFTSPGAFVESDRQST